MRLLTLADGFGDSNVMPAWYPCFFKWPEIIGFMTKGVDLVNMSRYGAGNEYLLQCLRHHKETDVALIQWAIPNRLDLVLSHTSDYWQQQIDSDLVYHNNIMNLAPDRYWLSSGSKVAGAQEYHQKFISLRQHQLRSQLFVEHATLLLLQHNIDYRFLLTWDSAYLQESVDNTNNWCWHEPFKGMHSFRHVSKFSSLDFDITQPISLIQFDFIKQFIMPGLNLPWRSNIEINAVENMLYRKHKDAVALRKNDHI